MVLVDAVTAALSWNVEPRTVRRWVAKGKLTNHGQPGAILVDLDAERPAPGKPGRKPKIAA